MKKINLTIGALLLGSVLFASNFVACGGDTPVTTGAAGTTGAGGTTGAAGTGSAPTDGGAGTGSAPTDGGSATLADGKCVANAFKRDGVCACQASVPNVCGDSCTDVKTDPANCGTCGNACGATSTCNNGTCGPAPTVVLAKVAGCGSMSIAVAGGKVWYAEKTSGKIGSVPVAGGAATPLTGAQAEKSPTAIAVNGTNVYWLSSAAPGAPVDGGEAPVAVTIRKSAAGAAPTDLVTATAPGGGIRGFVVSADGATVYYSSGVNIKSIPAAGGTSTDVAIEEHGGIPGALAIQGTKIAYPTDLNGDVDVITVVPGMVARCGKEDATKPSGYDMLNCVRIARSQGSLRKEQMLAFGDWAFWIDGTSVKGGELAPAGTAANDAIGSTILNPIFAMTNTATNIYFTEYDGNAPTGTSGIIQKTGTRKEQPQTALARGQVAPSSIAVDATKVYWSADCAINATGL